MIRRWLFAVSTALLIMASPAAFGQDEKSQEKKAADEKSAQAEDKKDEADEGEDEPQTPEEKFAAIEESFNDAMKEFRTAYEDAETRAEKNKVFQTKYPNADEYAKRFMELAEAHPDSAEAPKALAWAATRGGSVRGKASKMLLNDYASSEEVATVIPTLQYSREPGKAMKQLRSIIDENMNDKNKAVAMFTLGNLLASQAELRVRLDGDEEMQKQFANAYGEEYVESTMALDAKAIEKEAVGILETVVKKHGDVEFGRRAGNTLGKSASAKLFEMLNLAIGKVAPDIIGEDIFGEEFKLSEYRGKVVVLDFWGDW